MLYEEEDRAEDRDLAGERELYGDPDIATLDGKVPQFLVVAYLFWPIWGIMTLYFFWNGTPLNGWFNGGYWHELQVAAKTTFLG